MDNVVNTMEIIDNIAKNINNIMNNMNNVDNTMEISIKLSILFNNTLSNIDVINIIHKIIMIVL